MVEPRSEMWKYRSNQPLKPFALGLGVGSSDGEEGEVFSTSSTRTSAIFSFYLQKNASAVCISCREIIKTLFAKIRSASFRILFLKQRFSHFAVVPDFRDPA
jgi:hypothetical protein